MRTIADLVKFCVEHDVPLDTPLYIMGADIKYISIAQNASAVILDETECDAQYIREQGGECYDAISGGIVEE